jgi:hypothetical protein
VHELDCPRESNALIHWVIDHIIRVYTMAENRNDFFLLHGVTSSWALAQILPAIKSEETRMEILQGSILQNSVSAENFSDKFLILNFWANFLSFI